MSEQRFIAMVYDSKLHVIILWHKISVKFNICKKTTELGIVALNCKKNLKSSQTYRTDLRGSYNYLQKENWAHKCWHAIN